METSFSKLKTKTCISIGRLTDSTAVTEVLSDREVCSRRDRSPSTKDCGRRTSVSDWSGKDLLCGSRPADDKGVHLSLDDTVAVGLSERYTSERRHEKRYQLYFVPLTLNES